MSPTKKHRRLHRCSEEQRNSSAENLQLVITSEMTFSVILDEAMSLIENTEKEQASCVSEEEMLSFRDLPVEAYELSAILQHDTTYELIDFRSRF